MLRDKLNENITSLINITWLLRKAFKVAALTTGRGLLWFGLVSRVGASYRVNLIAPFPLGWTCPRKIDYVMICKYEVFDVTASR